MREIETLVATTTQQISHQYKKGTPLELNQGATQGGLTKTLLKKDIFRKVAQFQKRLKFPRIQKYIPKFE